MTSSDLLVTFNFKLTINFCEACVRGSCDQIWWLYDLNCRRSSMCCQQKERKKYSYGRRPWNLSRSTLNDPIDLTYDLQNMFNTLRMSQGLFHVNLSSIGLCWKFDLLTPKWPLTLWHMTSKIFLTPLECHKVHSMWIWGQSDHVEKLTFVTPVWPFGDL